MHAPSNPNFSHRDGREVRDVVERFTEHAARRPDAIALTLDEHSWSYARLDTVSDRLAYQLQSIGVAPGSFVALFLPRSFAQVAAIDGAQGGASPVETFWKYLLPVREIGVGRPVFFVPGGDGDVLAMGVYARLADYVLDRPFFGLRSTRIDGPACVLLPSVEHLAAAFITEMKRIQPAGPYDVAGGCIGGVIAFEMARQLAASGDVVHRVVLLDTVFPNRYQQIRALVRGACARLRFHLRRLLSFKHGTPRRLGIRIYDFISGFLPFTLFDAPPELHPVWIRFANCTMRYRPKPYAGKVHLILSEQPAGSDLGAVWGRKAKGGIAVTTVPGDHEIH